MNVMNFFASDPARYEGVRPVHIWGMRLFYLLMAVYVAPQAWEELLTHTGPWDPLEAVVWTVWATYPTLAVLGLLQPLRWLPILLFTVGYKGLWLALVAWPLWRAGTLAESPAMELTEVFMPLSLLVLVIPWGYVLRTYLLWPRSMPARSL